MQNTWPQYFYQFWYLRCWTIRRQFKQFYIWYINGEQSQLCIFWCSTHSRDRWNFRCKQLNVYRHECTWLQKRHLSCDASSNVIWLECSNLQEKHLLNCSVRIYQRIILNWSIEQVSIYNVSMFSCNKPMCLYKRQIHISNYCKFQLSSDNYREKPWSYSSVHWH